jgi:Flp pilus assembly protein TadD
LKRLGEALRQLEVAAEVEPNVARYSYVYAVALHSAGRTADAIMVLRGSVARHPDDRDISIALINLVRETGDVAGALEYAEQFSRIRPGDQNLLGLIQSLRRQLGDR